MKTMRLVLTLLLSQMAFGLPAQTPKPLRVGVIGLVHDHVNWILNRAKANDIEIVGIVEPNRALVQRYAKKPGFDVNLVYSTIEEMVENREQIEIARQYEAMPKATLLALKEFFNDEVYHRDTENPAE